MKPALGAVATLLAAVTLGAVPAVVAAETVLITGANSGLGLEFTKQYAAMGWTVIATHRRRDVPNLWSTWSRSIRRCASKRST